MSEVRLPEDLVAHAELKPRRSISFIWVVPLVALVIGGWLAFKAIREKGPTITITFDHAEGMEAGKTKIKYRDVDVGVIEKITLGTDISHIVVEAKLAKGSEKYLTDQTKFWVVRARVRGGSVSGISTLLSGAYIGVDPSKKGQPTTSFTGLEIPPVVTLGQPGRHFLLKTDSLGSIDIGAPVYYRQIQVGQVIGYNFAKDSKGVQIQVFINDPYTHQVAANTRFWNASGIGVSLDAEGLKMQTESLISIVSGGIAFDLPFGVESGGEAADGAEFLLYPDRKSIKEKSYTIRRHWMLVFNQSVRGLTIGAPVELHGIKVGEVVNLELEFDAETRQFCVPVLVAIEPERVHVVHAAGQAMGDAERADAFLKELIEQKGLRAQLQTGSLLTGQMMVNLGFFKNETIVPLTYRDGRPVIPTVPGSFDRLQESLVKVVSKLENIPFEKIGEQLSQLLNDTSKAMQEYKNLAGSLDEKGKTLLSEAEETMRQLGNLAKSFDRGTVPQMNNTLQELQETLETFRTTIGTDSPIIYNASKSLDELTITLQSIRDLMASLDERPESIIFGKKEEVDE